MTTRQNSHHRISPIGLNEFISAFWSNTYLSNESQAYSQMGFFVVQMTVSEFKTLNNTKYPQKVYCR